jgi:Ca2+-binding EF-hand superfamily protein
MNLQSAFAAITFLLIGFIGFIAALSDQNYVDGDFLASAPPKMSPKPDEHTLEVLESFHAKMDKDRDGKVTPDELHNWLRYLQTKYIRDGMASRWKDLQLENGKLLWITYVNNRFRGWTHTEDTELELEGEDSLKEKAFNYKLALDRDRRRWKMADEDGDDKLDKNEYMLFAYPEVSAKMRHIIVDENMENLDMDGDDKLSLEEFLADYDKKELEHDYDETPTWLVGDKEHFLKRMDLDGSGFVEKHEMASWLTPDMDGMADTEVTFVFKKVDDDQDGYITVEEFMNHYDILMHTQVTNHGDAIKVHDEL